MNPFEKIFNYQLLARLQDSGTFLATAHERSWLKLMLTHPSAAEAFSAVTLAKLTTLLQQDEALDLHGHFVQKAGSLEAQVYHPLLRPLRRAIWHKQGITMCFLHKDGSCGAEQSGFPYRLEYSMVKREWYLLWYNFRTRAYVSTRLRKLKLLSTEPLTAELVASTLAEIGRLLESRKRSAVITVLPEYNKELSRILYAFSCFEKEVAYDPELQTYSITLTFLGNESEYVLSKLRFLGKRVRVTEGGYLIGRMRESSLKALRQYGMNTPD
ncbi:hypothetical protein GCM10010912_39070 [Paenibacillus albidus]|uniref:WYL domain-containing protein n=1 Tax=Paenibacillus albidus TaxID=2041023 RepID=A0A917CK02_9BACL|nr:WYL domain-containing protein [Paenibacillus albidus]GGF90077.1 hypothetical protein GCM10010912_39070 [Paenibacillus albidus]